MSAVGTDGGGADAVVNGSDVEEEFARVYVDEAHDAVLTQHTQTLQQNTTNTFVSNDVTQCCSTVEECSCTHGSGASVERIGDELELSD